MYEQIVVALDGSADAEKILPYVETLARSYGSEVLLVGVTESAEIILAETMPTAPTAAFPEPSSIVDPTPIVDQNRYDMSAYLLTVRNSLRARGLRAVHQLLEGSPAEAILAAAENCDADLIAMTTYGRGGVGRLVFGSVADDVLRQAPCAMLLVRILENLEGAAVGVAAAVEDSVEDSDREMVPAG